jgi:hypothetical protein
MGVNPLTLVAFVLLSRLVSPLPIALAIPPQPGEGECESRRWLGCGERFTKIVHCHVGHFKGGFQSRARSRIRVGNSPCDLEGEQEHHCISIAVRPALLPSSKFRCVLTSLPAFPQRTRRRNTCKSYECHRPHQRVNHARFSRHASRVSGSLDKVRLGHFQEIESCLSVECCLASGRLVASWFLLTGGVDQRLDS